MSDYNIKDTSSFIKGNFEFPDDDIDPKKKDAKWILEYGRAIWAKYVKNQTSLPYSNLNEFITLRQYAEGRQDVSKYDKILLDQSEASPETTEGYMNINKDILSVMPKFLHIIRGIFEEQEHKVVASAVDPKSIDKKEKTKLDKWFKGRYKPIIDAVNAMSKVQPEPEWIPETIDELQLYESVGGLRLAQETEIEEAINYSFYISDWKEVKRKMLDDFATINCAAVKDYLDPYTQKAKTRYVDPANIVIQYSKHWDHRNSEYAGERIKDSISNIRKVTGIPSKDLQKIAYAYNGRNGNPSVDSWSDNELYGENGYCKFDSFQVDVFDFEFFSVNSEYRTKRTNKRGDTLEYDEKWGKVWNSDEKKTSVKDIKVVYRGKMVIGTDIIYDSGLQYDVPRPGKKEVELSFKFYKLPGRSIVSLAIPNLDNIQLTWLKLQNAIAMAANPGVAVEYTSLMNMTIGGKIMQPLEILQIRRDTGDLIWKATTHHGMPNIPGNTRPIQELTGGIGPQLMEYISIFELNLNFIRDLTGINKIADATTPDPNQSVGGSEMAIAATNNALKPIYSGYIRLKEQTARSLALRIQISLANNNNMYEGYIPVIGGTGVKILTIGADAVDADYSIMIQAKPTAQRKQAILQAAMEAMKRDKDGYTDIEYKDFLMIERLLEDGNEKLAEIVLTHLSEKNKKLKLQIQRENMQMDAESAQKTAMVKAQADKEKAIAENELKKDFETHVKTLEKDLEYNKHLWTMDEIRLQNSLKEEELPKQKTA